MPEGRGISRVMDSSEGEDKNLNVLRWLMFSGHSEDKARMVIGKLRWKGFFLIFYLF